MVGDLMAYPDKNKLSSGAMSAVYEKASQIILNWKPKLDMNVIQKGVECEDDAIELLNTVTGKQYVKNKDRISTDLTTGEWDIYDFEEDKIWDIKNAYSKKTFPIFLKEGDRKKYEWQLRDYMHLFGASNAGIAYCLVDTPEYLINRRDDPDWHVVSHLPPADRVTIMSIERCKEKEEQMLNKLQLAQDELKKILEARNFDISKYTVDF